MGLWDFAENQEKLNPPSKDTNTNLNDLEDDKVDDAEEEEVEEEEEEEEAEEGEEVETPLQKATPKGETKTTPGAEGQLDDATKQAVKEEFISRLGDKTILTIKGKQVNAADLSPDEIVNFLQKGIRGDQLFNENAATRRQLEEERAQLEQNALQIQEILAQQRTKKEQPVLPSHLVPHPDDSEEALAWKRDQVRLLDKVAAMESMVQNEAVNRQTKTVIDEVVNLAKDYPMASIDECLAVKSVRPGVNSEELTRASHNYYSGEPFIRKALGANPEFKRKYDSEVIKNYLSGKSTTKRMPGTKRGSSNIDRVTSPEKKLKVRSFDDADKYSRQFFKEIKRMERQEE